MAVGIGGCVSAPAVAPSPPTQPDNRSWADVPCDAVADRNREACIAEHQRLGIPENLSTGGAQAATRASIYDEQAQLADKVPVSPDVIEHSRKAVDVLLGGILKDPMSAIQYRVTPLLPCTHVLAPEGLIQNAPFCLCYEVNSKNSYGGYEGSTMDVAALSDEGEGAYKALQLDRMKYQHTFRDACNRAGFEKRKAEMIHATVE